MIAVQLDPTARAVNVIVLPDGFTDKTFDGLRVVRVRRTPAEWQPDIARRDRLPITDAELAQDALPPS